MKIKKNSQQLLIYVEGETEKALVSDLNVLGRISKINLWEKPLHPLIRTLRPNQKVLVVYDTDHIQSQGNLERFVANIKLLKTYSALFGIMQQTQNLEDELVAACAGLNDRQQLFRLFDATGANEFKELFIKAGNRIVKLQKNGFNADNLWRQATHNKLSILDAHRTFHANLPKK